MKKIISLFLVFAVLTAFSIPVNALDDTWLDTQTSMENLGEDLVDPVTTEEPILEESEPIAEELPSLEPEESEEPIIEEPAIEEPITTEPDDSTILPCEPTVEDGQESLSDEQEAEGDAEGTDDTLDEEEATDEDAEAEEEVLESEEAEELLPLLTSASQYIVNPNGSDTNGVVTVTNQNNYPVEVVLMNFHSSITSVMPYEVSWEGLNSAQTMEMVCPSLTVDNLLDWEYMTIPTIYAAEVGNPMVIGAIPANGTVSFTVDILHGNSIRSGFETSFQIVFSSSKYEGGSYFQVEEPHIIEEETTLVQDDVSLEPSEA